MSPYRKRIGGGMITGSAVNAVAGPSPVPGNICSIGLPVSGRPVLPALPLDGAILVSPLLLLPSLHRRMSGPPYKPASWNTSHHRPPLTHRVDVA